MAKGLKTAASHTFFWLVIAFLYFPVIVLAFYSFTDAAMLGAFGGFTFDNYVTLFTNEALISMMVGTILLALVVSLLSTFLGTLGAVGAYYSKKTHRSLTELVNEIPVVNADVVTGFSACILMIILFRMNKDSFVPLVIAQTTLCTPFVYLSVYPRLVQMDDRLFEAAMDLGCTPGQALIKVVLPQTIPGIINGFVTAVTLSLDDYFIATYTKPAAFDTISTYVVNATKGAQTEVKTALWALSAIIFVLVVAGVAAMNMRGYNNEES